MGIDWPTAAVALGALATVAAAIVARWPRKRSGDDVLYAKLVDFVRLETQFIGFRGEMRAMKEDLKQRLDAIDRKLT